MSTHDTIHIPEWWREMTLGEVVEITSSKRIFAEEYKDSWVPFYRGKEIIEKFNGGKISTELYISEEKYHEINTKFGAPKWWDMLLTSVWTIWIPYIVRNDERFYFKDWNLTWFKGFNGILNIFLFYWLTSEYGKEEIQRHKIWSTQEALTIVWLKSISLPLPPLPEQRAIADMLSSLDAKIELLREQNETLEKTAQTIFQEWFGRYSVESPEELPEGWRVGKIMEIIKREPVSYKCDKKDIDSNGTIPIIDQWTNGLYWYTSRSPDFIASPEKPVILFTNHTCNYWFIDYPFCAIQNVLPYRGKDGYDEYFLYFMTKWSITFIEYKWHWPDFEAKDFIIPSVEKAQEFSKLAKPILEKVSFNNSQIQFLSKTRDILLLKLMSGEVRVV